MPWLPTHATCQPWSAERVARHLLVISACYLALPHVVFYFGWLKLPYAVVAAGSLCAALVAVWRMVMAVAVPPAADPAHAGDRVELTEAQTEGQSEAATHASNRPIIFTRQDALMIGGLCLVWLTLAGIGGFVTQDLDWNKHNTVLNSLLRKPWPTVYEIYKVDVPLVYYIAYYLPAALVGKVGGWLWMNVALYVWSFVGVGIALLWFSLLVRRVAYSVLLIFIFFSGLDVIGNLLAVYGVWNIGERFWQHIDAWAGVWQYSSNATLLNWVPPQAIGGWVATGMLLYCLLILRRRTLILLPFGLSALWSPFVTLGLLPYLVIDFLVDQVPFRHRVRHMITIPNVVGVLVLGFTGFYYSSKLTEGSPIVIQDMLSGLSLGAYRGSVADAITFLLFFCLVEFGLYVIVLYRSGAVREEQWRWLFDITVVALFILPWFKLGVYNDLVMRASIPALFMLAVVVTRAVLDDTLTRQSRTVLVVLLVIGAVTPAIEFKRQVERLVTQPTPLFEAATQRWDFVYYMQRSTFFFGQYAGSVDAPFFQSVAKPMPDATPVPESDEAELNQHDFVLYGEGIYLLSDTVTVSPPVSPPVLPTVSSAVAAGETVTLTMQVHFFGPKYLQPYAPLLRLADEAGQTVWLEAGWPVAQPEIAPFSMTHWTGTFPITVPVTVAPGHYTLQVGFTNGLEINGLAKKDVKTNSAEAELLEATSVPEGESRGQFVPVATVEVIDKRER